MSIKANYPTVRPSLNLDFANSKRLDPRVTFSRVSTATYVDANGVIQTAAANTPRFDHDPATGESLGLLVEESRSNLQINSNTPTWLSDTQGYGTLMSSSLVTTSTPIGTSSAWLLTVPASWSQTPRIMVLMPATNGFYTFSIFVKAITSDINLSLSRFDGSFAVSVNLTTRIFGSPSQGTNHKIENYGNGWYRISGSAQSSTTGSNYGGSIGFECGTPNAQFYAWGLQIEQGSFPTSYIPTTGSQVTRSADVVQMTGTNFSSWYRQDEGTIFTSSLSARITAAAVSLYNSSPLEEIINYGLTNASGFGVYTSGAHQAQIGLGGASAGQRIVTAGAYKLNDFAASRNGSAAVIDTSGSVPTGIKAMNIGVDYSGSFPSWGLNGTISRVAFYPKRLTDAQLQSLTAN